MNNQSLVEQNNETIHFTFFTLNLLTLRPALPSVALAKDGTLNLLKPTPTLPLRGTGSSRRGAFGFPVADSRLPVAFR
jgi:hypothetical protein